MSLAAILAEAPEQPRQTKSVIVQFFEGLSPEDQEMFVKWINSGQSPYALYRYCRTAGMSYSGGPGYFTSVARRIAANYETEVAA